MNYYAAADRMIQTLNRLSVEEFGKLKGIDFEELKATMTIRELYRYLLKILRNKAYEVAFEAYVLWAMDSGVEVKKAHAMAEDAIDADWVAAMLEWVDPVTLYRFDKETERKADRLIEAISVFSGGSGQKPSGKKQSRQERRNTNRNAEIDRAMRYWSMQVGQFAISITDMAGWQAMHDAGVDRAMWITAGDEKVCHECRKLDGQVFPLDELPTKPHRGCRCRWAPVRA